MAFFRNEMHVRPHADVRQHSSGSLCERRWSLPIQHIGNVTPQCSDDLLSRQKVITKKVARLMCDRETLLVSRICAAYKGNSETTICDKTAHKVAPIVRHLCAQPPIVEPASDCRHSHS